ncbi:MAG: hypothetical protein ACXIUZ_11790 [Lysobacteraceae bacterium]
MKELPDRVQAAIDGKLPFDALSEYERVYLLEAFENELFTPNAETAAYFQSLVEAGGAVGLDEDGRFVRAVPGGALEPLQDE